MKTWGLVGLIAGGLLLAFGLLGDTTVASVDGFGRMHNIGLLGARAAMVTAGAGLIVAGSVFYVGGELLDRLDSIRDHQAAPPSNRPPAPIALRASPAAAAAPQEPASTSTAGATAPRPPGSPNFPASASAWRDVSGYAEERGWRVTAGLLGVTLTSPDGRKFKPTTAQEVADIVTTG